MLQCALGAGDGLFTASITHRWKGVVSNEQMEMTMMCAGKLLDDPESGSSVGRDITPEACMVSLTRVLCSQGVGEEKAL